MKKIQEGKVEILTDKTTAIKRLMQLQGVCREETSNEKTVRFLCSKNGKIAIVSRLAGGRRAKFENSTQLFAKVTEENGKTYASYYTSFSSTSHVMKLISLTINMIAIAFAIVFAFLSGEPTAFIAFLFLGLVIFMFTLFSIAKERKNSPMDSEILIEELERRIVAVNHWNR